MSTAQTTPKDSNAAERHHQSSKAAQSVTPSAHGEVAGRAGELRGGLGQLIRDLADAWAR